MNTEYKTDYVSILQDVKDNKIEKRKSIRIHRISGKEVDDKMFTQIPSFSRYYVNRSGNVVYDSLKKKAKTMTVQRKAPRHNKVGEYYQVCLKSDTGVWVSRGVHVFVALAYLTVLEELFDKAFKTSDTIDIDHIDKNPVNNEVSNLRYMLHKDNCHRRVVDRLGKEVELA